MKVADCPRRGKTSGIDRVSGNVDRRNEVVTSLGLFRLCEEALAVNSVSIDLPEHKQMSKHQYEIGPMIFFSNVRLFLVELVMDKHDFKILTKKADKSEWYNRTPATPPVFEGTKGTFDFLLNHLFCP